MKLKKIIIAIIFLLISSVILFELIKTYKNINSIEKEIEQTDENIHNIYNIQIQ